MELRGLPLGSKSYFVQMAPELHSEATKSGGTVPL